LLRGSKPSQRNLLIAETAIRIQTKLAIEKPAPQNDERAFLSVFETQYPSHAVILYFASLPD
jgi:hypothetical protein